MTRSRIAARTLCLAPALAVWVSFSARAQTPSFVGVWKGTSLCQIKDSPCHDEGAVYTVKAAAPGSFEFSGDKVVDGKQQFMGTLECNAGTDSNSLVCKRNDDMVWTWKLHGDSMSGTLMYRGQLFRKISLTRAK